MGFFQLLYNWGEEYFEANQEYFTSICEMHKPVMNETSTTAETRIVKPSQTMNKLSLQKA
jgi:hypothetical protein